MLGWRSTFGVVAILAVLLGIRYWSQLGETHSADKRAPISITAILKTYRLLLGDRRFIAPALSVSLVIGSLYMFFAMAPAILMTGFGFAPLGLSLFFASTVFVVFGAGILAPKLAHRWGSDSGSARGHPDCAGREHRLAARLGRRLPYFSFCDHGVSAGHGAD